MCPDEQEVEWISIPWTVTSSFSDFINSISSDCVQFEGSLRSFVFIPNSTVAFLLVLNISGRSKIVSYQNCSEARFHIYSL